MTEVTELSHVIPIETCISVCVIETNIRSLPLPVGYVYKLVADRF